jgi:hypothetical protein
MIPVIGGLALNLALGLAIIAIILMSSIYALEMAGCFYQDKEQL